MCERFSEENVASKPELAILVTGSSFDRYHTIIPTTKGWYEFRIWTAQGANHHIKPLIKIARTPLQSVLDGGIKSALVVALKPHSCLACQPEAATNKTNASQRVLSSVLYLSLAIVEQKV